MSRTGASRSEIVATVVVVALVALGVWALWPSSPEPTAPGAAPGTSTHPDSDPATADPVRLAAARGAAGMQPCPAPTGAPPTGPLTGITVPCLGAGGRVDVAAAVAGKTVLVNFWASWCAPCREELPVISEYAGRPGAVPVLTVDVQDDPVTALGLATELGVRLPALTDPRGELRAAMSTPPVLPFNYVVRTDGKPMMVDPPVPFRTADDVASAVERLR